MEKIMLAPDSYKGSLSAIEVCDVLASVISKHFPQCEIVKMPMSDGGEGFSIPSSRPAEARKYRPWCAIRSTARSTQLTEYWMMEE